MSEMEFRAYDSKQKLMVYNNDLWLPKGLKKLGHQEYPVFISKKGIHYTLDCISNHYENDWEEDVVTAYAIEIMQFTEYFDCSQNKKIYNNDIVSFSLKDDVSWPVTKNAVGRITYCHHVKDWVVVDKDDLFIELLSKLDQPVVIGNWFDNPELLDTRLVVN